MHTVISCFASCFVVRTSTLNLEADIISQTLEAPVLLNLVWIVVCNPLHCCLQPFILLSATLQCQRNLAQESALTPGSDGAGVHSALVCCLAAALVSSPCTARCCCLWLDQNATALPLSAV